MKKVVLFFGLVFFALVVFFWIRGPVVGRLPALDNDLPVVVEVYCRMSNLHGGGQRVGYSVHVKTPGSWFVVGPGLSGAFGCHAVFSHPDIEQLKTDLTGGLINSIGLLEFRSIDEAIEQAAERSGDVLSTHMAKLDGRYFPELMAQTVRTTEQQQLINFTIANFHTHVEKIRLDSMPNPDAYLDDVKKTMRTLRAVEKAAGFPGAVEILCHAVQREGLQAVKAVLADGAYANGWCKGGGVPLLHALEQGSIAKFEVLRASGADIADPWMIKPSLLEIAVQSRRLDMVVHTLQHFPDATYRMDTRNDIAGLLYRAGTDGDIALLAQFHALHNSELDLDLQTTTGFNALHGAFKARRIAAVEQLLALGADPNLRTNAGAHLWDYATEPGELRDLLIEWERSDPARRLTID